MKPRLKIKKSINLLFLVACLSWACRSFSLPDINRSVSDVRNWLLYGGEPNRSGFRHRPTRPTFEHVWTYELTSAPGKAITVANGIVVIPTLDGRIDFVDIETGQRLGRMKTEDREEATCALQDNLLFIASRYGNHSLVAYRLNSGNYLWQINAGSVASEPLITGDGIYISALYKHIDKYDVQTGKRLWTFATTGQHHSSPAIDNHTVVVGCDTGILYAINAETGELKWQTSLTTGIMATPIIKEGKVFVGSIDSTF
ncbi:MAG: PQQ-binding-like beta-propeller repeat protein, partial [bacterium]